MMYGIDYLGGAAYRAVIRKNHPKGWAAGFFANTFGNAWASIRVLAKTGKCPLFRVHAVWADNHTYNKTVHDKVIKSACKKCVNFAKTFPDIKFQFSPFCEHMMKTKELTRIFNYCKKIVGETPNIEFVNCAWTGDFIYGDEKIINETHNYNRIPDKGSYNYSFDGLDCYNADTQAIKNKCNKSKVFFFWTISMNLKRKDDERLTVAQRLARDYRPNGKNIKAMIAMANEKGKTSLPNTCILKPMSEDTGDLKSNRCLLLIPDKADKIELVDPNSKKKVITMTRFDPPFEGKYRYYSLTDKAGYEVREEAIKKFGTDLVAIKINNKLRTTNGVVNLVNPAFRDGTYKNHS